MSAPIALEQIEAALLDRLRQGLGRLVLSVESYGGELDELTAEVVRSFPAVWATFGGITASVPTGTSKQIDKVTGQWVVMVAARNVSTHNAARQGSVGEVGAYQLVRAVRRLLQRQDLGLPIDHLKPGRVRTLYNTRISNQAMCVFACEFSTAWLEHAMDNGAWPIEGKPEDAVFNQNHGKKDTEAPDLLRISVDYDLTPPGDGKPDAADLITLKESQP